MSTTRRRQEPTAPVPTRPDLPGGPAQHHLRRVLAHLTGGRARILALGGRGERCSLPRAGSRAFDVVVAARGVLARRGAAVEQEHTVHRVAGLLRPGGHLVVQTDAPSAPTREDLARWASAAGLAHCWTADRRGSSAAPVDRITIFVRVGVHPVAALPPVAGGRLDGWPPSLS